MNTRRLLESTQNTDHCQQISMQAPNLCAGSHTSTPMLPPWTSPTRSSPRLSAIMLMWIRNTGR
eukprot:2331717-Amphidinium_carterae.1